MNYLFKAILLVMSSTLCASENSLASFKTSSSFLQCPGWKLEEKNTNWERLLVATHACTQHLCASQEFTLDILYQAYSMPDNGSSISARARKRVNNEKFEQLEQIVRSLKGRCCELDKKEVLK